MSQNLDLLDTPLRLSWNISGEGRLSISSLNKCADEVVDAGVFFVLLTGLAADISDCGEVVDRLVSGGCRVSVVVSGRSVLDSELISQLNGDVFIDCSPFMIDTFDVSGLKALIAQYRDTNCNPGLSLVPDRENLLSIVNLLNFCVAEGVSVLKLPNTPIDNSSLKLIDTSLLAIFEEQWQATEVPDVSNIKLEIHDLFLWRIMSKKSEIDRSEYGGCQAANSLAHIDSHGNIRPCSSWPDSLGSLLKSSFDDLWSSKSRRNIVANIKKLPTLCTTCGERMVCFGGCRGIALACTMNTNSPDILCPYVEKSEKLQ